MQPFVQRNIIPMEPEISARWRWKIFTEMRRPKLPQAQGALVWLKMILHLHHFSLGQQEQLSKSSHLGSVPRSFQRPCALYTPVHGAWCRLYTAVHFAHYTQLAWCTLDPALHLWCTLVMALLYPGMCKKDKRWRNSYNLGPHFHVPSWSQSHQHEHRNVKFCTKILQCLCINNYSDGPWRLRTHQFSLIQETKKCTQSARHISMEMEL